MRKDFKAISALCAVEFEAYFNQCIADELLSCTTPWFEKFAAKVRESWLLITTGAGAGASTRSLSKHAQKRIESIRYGLYEKVQKAKEHHLTTVIDNYSKLEKAHIQAAIVALQSNLGTAPAAASSVPASGVLHHPSLGGLRDGPMRHLASYLSPKEGNRLALASRELHIVLKGGPTLLKFLLHVACGQQDEAAAMLSTDASLLTQAGEFTDYSGRRFSCTAYEYAYWAKDTHMCRMLETYMDEKAKAIIRKRIDRMEAIDPATRQARGLVYWQKGRKHQSAHFDFTPLISALREFIKGCNCDWYGRNYGVRNGVWKTVGMAQLQIPAHVAQEYCRSDRSFEPTPTFTETTLPRELSFHNHHTGLKRDSWFPAPARPDSLFSLVRGNKKGAHGEDGSIEFEDTPRVDLVALRQLDEVRTRQLIVLRARLNPGVATATASTAAGGSGASADGLSHLTGPGARGSFGK